MAGELTIRGATATDAQRIWRLVSEHGGVELNSCYAYVLLCTHFAQTCVVAEQGDALAGYVVGYRPPSHPEELFVWQVAVAPSARGQGLGARLLDAVMQQPGAQGAQYLSATVSPDNAASMSLFNGFAKRRGVSCVVGQGFPSHLFADPHADEKSLRIGPLRG